MIENLPDDELDTIKIEELQKPSKGSELIEKIRKGELLKGKESLTGDPDFASVIKDGVEVVDVKAMEKKIDRKNEKGIPSSENRKNWDRV